MKRCSPLQVPCYSQFFELLSRRLDHLERTSQEPGSASAAYYSIAPRKGAVVNVIEYAGSLAAGAADHRLVPRHSTGRTATQRDCGDVASALGFIQHQIVLPLGGDGRFRCKVGGPRCREGARVRLRSPWNATITCSNGC